MRSAIIICALVALAFAVPAEAQSVCEGQIINFAGAAYW